MAFPVMTLAFKLPPFVARDFTLNAQAIGMCAALFTIFWMRVSSHIACYYFEIICNTEGLYGVLYFSQLHQRS